MLMRARYWLGIALCSLGASGHVWADACATDNNTAQQARLDTVLAQLQPLVPAEGAALELTPLSALPAIAQPHVKLLTPGLRNRLAVELSGVSCGSTRSTVSTVWFKARAMREAWVYGRNGKADSAAAATQPRREQVDMAALQAKASDLPDSLDGLWLKQSVNAGMPVLKRHLQPEPLVQRLAPVTVVVYGPSLMLRTQGKAMAPGALGDTVAVLVDGSESSVQAVVAGKGEVHVER